jgi:RimJ/RimL family protein N-acetyltransferase
VLRLSPADWVVGGHPFAYFYCPRLKAMLELLFPAPPLADETVLLRPWQETDVPDMAMAFSDPVIQQFSWAEAAAFTEDDAAGQQRLSARRRPLRLRP